jgi:hypothetical protein
MVMLKGRLVRIKNAFFACGGEVEFHLYEWNAVDMEGEKRLTKRARAVVSAIKWPDNNKEIYEKQKLPGPEISPAAAAANFYKNVPPPSTASSSTANLRAFLDPRQAAKDVEQIGVSAGAVQSEKDLVEQAAAGCRNLLGMLHWLYV